MTLISITIGRSTESMFVVNDPAVSSQHAVIQSDLNGHYWIVDAGSKNGTFVNGKRIYQETPVSANDEILIGSTRLQLEFILQAALPGVPAQPSMQNAHQGAPPGPRRRARGARAGGGGGAGAGVGWGTGAGARPAAGPCPAARSRAPTA